MDILGNIPSGNVSVGNGTGAEWDVDLSLNVSGGGGNFGGNVGEDDLLWEERFRDGSRFWVQRVLVPVVVMVGVLGNLVTIYILTRRPMRSSTNVYLCALAVSDLLFLLFTFSMSLTHYPSFDSYWFYWSYKPFGLWLTDAASSTSVWLTVSFTIERYIAVCHPMRGKVLCTEERAIKVAILVYVICFAVTSPTPFEWKLENHMNAKNITIYRLVYSDFGNDETYQKLFYWFTSITFIILPVFILGILNFILIQAVRHSRVLRKTMTQNLKSTSVRQMQTMRQENRITITLIGVVIVFLICQVPTALVLIYVSFYPDPSRTEGALLRAFGNICNLLVALNASCNFLLYTALSDKYRKYFCAFFFCWRRGRHGRAGSARGVYYDNSNLYELDSMNTTVSLSRATSLRADLSPSRCVNPGGGGGVGYGSGLRRAQTCHPTNLSIARSILKKEKAGNETAVNLNVNMMSGLYEDGGSGSSSGGNSKSFKNNFASANTSRGHHIKMKDACIPLIKVDQV